MLYKIRLHGGPFDGQLNETDINVFGGPTPACPADRYEMVTSGLQRDMYARRELKPSAAGEWDFDYQFDEAAQLRQRFEEMRSALMVYAEPENWKPADPRLDLAHDLTRDKYALARHVLGLPEIESDPTITPHPTGITIVARDEPPHI